MTFTLSIDMDNAAFDDDPSTELIDCLRRVAAKVCVGTIQATVLDSNGNTVGSWEIK